MTTQINLSIVIFLPLAAALLTLAVPPRFARWLVLAGTLLVLGYTVKMIVDFVPGIEGLQYLTNKEWIPELGIRYKLGVDGLSVFLIAMTALLWFVATLAAAFGSWERPRLFFFHLALGETAVLGSFCAQDLALFVLFFDLMLVPFYFLIGMWGRGGGRVQATTKFVIYTLVGSLLMLAGTVALGVLSVPEGGDLTFSLRELEERDVLAPGTQAWIFLLFAAAFLVKAPAFPLHGWLPDAYRAAPIPVVLLLSAVLSKVGVYAFLRIVMPILPDATVQFQPLLLAIAVFSILYGSALAFSQDDVRLIVGYSSIAQLGFITLGIFVFDAKGAQGAVMQMINHGLVTAALFLIIGALAVRAQGSESLERMGGIAFRAPVFAALFLIVGLATLAMPGTPNFVGELLILFGAFDKQLVFGLVASVGVALAAVYMIRLFQRSMHNPVRRTVVSRDLSGAELAPLAPLVLVIIALGVYPQPLLERSERSTVSRVERLQERGRDAAPLVRAVPAVPAVPGAGAALAAEGP
ncbi:MAG: NADH-quinone oxidoreductase subunit M [Actinomycetota bacterium]|nr:NADH-quinone oxidoreductase subunit M [Actinomycetota bacterium]